MGSHTSASSVIIAASAGFVIIAAASVPIGSALDASALYVVKALVLFGAIVAVVAASLRDGHPYSRFGPANTVTMARAACVTLVAALVGERASAMSAVVIIAVASGITALDGLDGRLARRTSMASAFGARFDMETDALLILVLSILTWQHGKAGAWIVLSGLMRYVFILAGWTWACMRQPLPPSLRRKAVCVVQIVSLLVALLPSVAPPASTAVAATSLALLAWSFGVDTLWLWRAAAHRTIIVGVND
jgi:phosphatidylglycerophosphate synthase